MLATFAIVIGVVVVIGQGILIALALWLIRTFGQFTESVLLLNSSLLGLATDSIRHRVMHEKVDPKPSLVPVPAPFTSDESAA